MHAVDYLSNSDIKMGGMSKIGAGKKALVRAVSFKAFPAAIFDTPTTWFCESTTSIPVESSVCLMRTTLHTLALAERKHKIWWGEELSLDTETQCHIFARPTAQTYSSSEDISSRPRHDFHDNINLSNLQKFW